MFFEASFKSVKNWLEKYEFYVSMGQWSIRRQLTGPDKKYIARSYIWT